MSRILKNWMVAAILMAMGMMAQAQRIAVICDIHVTPGNANESKLREVVSQINQSDADVVVFAGDLTNEGSDEQLRNVKTIIDGLTKPVYVIPGNHENTWSQSACKTFNDIWGQDRFVFNMGKLLVVGMNCGPFMKMGDGHIKQEDLIWLDKTLGERVQPGMKVLSINHYPLLDDLDNYKDYVNILKKYPVITHQSGHYHRWKQYETLGISGVMLRSLDMGKGDYGYSLLDVDLNRGWMHVYNMQLGAEPELKYAYKMNTDFDDFELDTQRNEVPAGFEVTKLFADNASIFTRLGVDDKCIYFGNSLGYCKAIDKVTAQVKWEFGTDAMLFARPAVSKKFIILPTADRRLVWLDKTTGKMLWAHDANGPYVADGVIEGNVLYQGGYKTFQAWDVNKHKLVWQYDAINNYCQAAPVISGNDVVFGAWDTNLRVLNKKDGALKWSWNNGNTANLLSPGNVVPCVNADKVMIVAPDRVATALSRADGKQLWRVKNENKVRESLGMSPDGKVAYAKTMDGELVAMSLEGNEYKLLWKVDMGFGYEHAPCIVLEHNGYIYAGSRRGRLAVINAATHALEFTYTMGSSEVNGFEADAQGNVYCSLIEGTIYRISHK